MAENQIEDRVRALLDGSVHSGMPDNLPDILRGRQRETLGRRRRLLAVTCCLLALVVAVGAGRIASQDGTEDQVFTAADRETGATPEPQTLRWEWPQLDLSLTLTTSESAPLIQRTRERLDRVSEIQISNGDAGVPAECYPDRAFYVEAAVRGTPVSFVGDTPDDQARDEPDDDRDWTLAYPPDSPETPVPFARVIAATSERAIAVLVVRVHEPTGTSTSVELASGESVSGSVQSGWSVLAVQLPRSTDPLEWYRGEVRVLGEDGSLVAHAELPHESRAGDAC